MIQAAMVGPLLAKFAPHVIGLGLLIGAYWWHKTTVDEVTRRAEAAEVDLERAKAGRALDRELYAQAQARAAQQRAEAAQRIVDERVELERKRAQAERRARFAVEAERRALRDDLARVRAALVAMDVPCLVPADLGVVFDDAIGDAAPDDRRGSGGVPGAGAARAAPE